MSEYIDLYVAQARVKPNFVSTVDTGLVAAFIYGCRLDEAQRTLCSSFIISACETS